MSQDKIPSIPSQRHRDSNSIRLGSLVSPTSACLPALARGAQALRLQDHLHVREYMKTLQSRLFCLTSRRVFEYLKKEITLGNSRY